MPASPAPPDDRSLTLRHMPSLDSIRGFAILMVLLFHGYGGFDWTPLGSFWGPLCHAAVGYGRLGVQLFFVLSGFLITGLLMKARERTDYYQNFYMRRVLRIVPVYLVMLAVLKIWKPVSWGFVLASLLFMANFSRLFGAPLREYGSLWSLAVEEHFYLLWPTFVRRLRVEQLIKILIGVIIAEPLLRAVAININSNIDIHYKTPFVLDYIAYGALLALLIRTGRIHLENARRIGIGLVAVGGLITLGTVWLTAFHMSNTLDALFEAPFEWACCGVLLLGLKSDHTRLVTTGETDSHGILPFFGYISYGLYLVNVLIYEKVGDYIVRHLVPGATSSFGMLTLMVISCATISTGIAYVSRAYFEAPILHLKDRLQDRFAASAAARAKAAAQSANA